MLETGSAQSNLWGINLYPDSYGDEDDLVVAVSPTSLDDLHPATLQVTLDAAHCLFVADRFHDNDLLQVFGSPSLGEPCSSEAIGALSSRKG